VSIVTGSAGSLRHNAACRAGGYDEVVPFRPRLSAILSLGIALFFSAWWACGPAPNQRRKPVAGGLLYFSYLEKHPEKWPTEPDYTLWPQTFSIDFGVIILFASIWPAGLALQWTVIQLRERAFRRIGHCANCGYDLRATPQRCPECGREAGAAAANSPLDIRP
jgi:hypothetical protein